MKANASVASAQNGIPWLYFYKPGGPRARRRIESVDPKGAVDRRHRARADIGWVVYPAAVLQARGVVHHFEGRRFARGEPDGSVTERCRRFSEALAAGGMKAPIDTKIREQIWVKLMGNAAFNLFSVLTWATIAEICRFGPTREVTRQIMVEILKVANALGHEMLVSVERRLAGAERVGHRGASMLQDCLAGKRLELEALLGAALDLAELTSVEVPRLHAIHASVSLLSQHAAGSWADPPAVRIHAPTAQPAKV